MPEIEKGNETELMLMRQHAVQCDLVIAMKELSLALMQKQAGDEIAALKSISNVSQELDDIWTRLTANRKLIEQLLGEAPRNG